MLKLPNVTLVLIETREHDLAKLALEECENKVKFADVLIFTDNVDLFDQPNRRIIKVPDWPEKIGWSKCFWYDVAPHVRTSHALGIQWDSWVLEPDSWRDEFLQYDYIGSPWWHTDGLNVGNGGFSLRSTTLMRFISKNRTKYVCETHLDDALYSRKYRPALEQEGFVWASEDIADYFAFELVDPIRKTFGFHGAFNFPRVMPLDKLVERARMMSESPNIFGGRIWNAFTRRIREKHPEIIKELESLCNESGQQRGELNG